jgi:hypothetical protein
MVALWGWNWPVRAPLFAACRGLRRRRFVACAA